MVRNSARIPQQFLHAAGIPEHQVQMGFFPPASMNKNLKLFQQIP